MTSPTQPPGGPQKKPEPPKTEPKAKDAKGNSFDAMLGKAKLTKPQREAFYNSLMQQAAATIKGAFRHLVDTMKRNQRGD